MNPYIIASAVEQAKSAKPIVRWIGFKKIDPRHKEMAIDIKKKIREQKKQRRKVETFEQADGDAMTDAEAIRAKILENPSAYSPDQIAANRTELDRLHRKYKDAVFQDTLNWGIAARQGILDNINNQAYVAGKDAIKGVGSDALVGAVSYLDDHRAVVPAVAAGVGAIGVGGYLWNQKRKKQHEQLQTPVMKTS